MAAIEEINSEKRTEGRAETVKSINKDILLHRIASLIIKLTYKYHKEDKDIVGELYNNNLAVNQTIGQEMEKIRMKERGIIQ